MLAEREKMVVALKETIVPVLRQQGFKGSFPHFRRIADTTIHLLSFQFSSWGGAFAINVGICERSGVLLTNGQRVPPEKVAAHHTLNYRLGSSEAQRDHWFFYDERSPHSSEQIFKLVAGAVIPYLVQAEQWWKENT